jgi:heme/copper-type cytochrome/quinol oxidase subunit 3
MAISTGVGILIFSIKSVPQLELKEDKKKTDSDSESVFIFIMAWCIVFSTFISINFFLRVLAESFSLYN